jgi:hypothetical protein
MDFTACHPVASCRLQRGRHEARRSRTGTPASNEAIKVALAAKKGIRRIARELQTGVGTVVRIKAELKAYAPREGAMDKIQALSIAGVVWGQIRQAQPARASQ